MDPLLIMMLLAVGAMFLLTNRTRRQQAKAAEFRQHLAVGDEVMTGSGMFGTIIDIDGDVITLESPSGAQTDWARAAIAKLAAPPYAEVTDEDAEVTDEDERTDEEDLDDEVAADEEVARDRPGGGAHPERDGDGPEDVHRHP